MADEARVVAVSASPEHTFSKIVQPAIQVVAGLGVAGDAHSGATVRHRYLVRRDPGAPNLAQVHLLNVELLAGLAARGIGNADGSAFQPGQLGENVAVAGLDLLALPVGTRLHLGAQAVVELTGLRTPCRQMNALHPGLMEACLMRRGRGIVERRAGVMALAIHSGTVAGGNRLRIVLPQPPHRPLKPV